MMSLPQSLSFLVSASELAVKMSEEAVAAVEKAAVVAREANIQAITALTAARLALGRENRRNSEDTPATPAGDADRGDEGDNEEEARTESEDGENETIEHFMNINIEEEEKEEERSDENQSKTIIISNSLYKPKEPKKKKNIFCDNCPNQKKTLKMGIYISPLAGGLQGVAPCNRDAPNTETKLMVGTGNSFTVLVCFITCANVGKKITLFLFLFLCLFHVGKKVILFLFLVVVVRGFEEQVYAVYAGIQLVRL